MAVIFPWILTLACIAWPIPVHGHIRLWVPPGRSTMWRFGYPTPINYQDNELFCGGFSHQVSLGYKCGVCGDPYDGKRDNEAGEKYATGIVTRTYTQGQEVTFEVDITANHKGYVEFRICPTNDHLVRETQDCFHRHPLSLSDGSGTRYFVHSRTGIMAMNFVLPSDLTCTFCVVQMRYHTGNSWGTDPDQTSCVGCGHQEEFYGCADIRIVAAGSSQTSGPQGISSRPTATETTGSSDRRRPETNGLNQFERTEKSAPKSSSEVVTPTTSSGISQGKGSSSVTPTGLDVTKEGMTNSSDNSRVNATNGDNKICRGVDGQSSLDNWCQLNCQSGHCPPSHCSCARDRYVHETARPVGCRAAGGYAKVPGFDFWCKQNCALGNCPSTHCVC